MPSSSSTKLHMLISVLALFWTRSLWISILITVTGVIGSNRRVEPRLVGCLSLSTLINIEAQR